MVYQFEIGLNVKAFIRAHVQAVIRVTTLRGSARAGQNYEV